MSEQPDPPTPPTRQALQWLGARLADLTAAARAATAATAGLVWTLSPWLVFAALAAGVAALVSTDARGWLTIQAERAGALVAGEQAGPPGFLYLEAPQVYTRERLVNDRFTQANWLREQLERTGSDSFIDDFSRPSAASEAIQRLVLTLRAGGLGAAAAEGDDAKATASAPEEVALDRLDLFGKVNVYRSALRGELMDVQLDDGHDLDGNTLYRLNFNAVVAPFQDQRKYPGSAVFLIRAKKPDRTIDEMQLIEDDEELLSQWQREMQAFLTRVLEQRLEDFERQSALENPTDPKEDLALDWFMRTRLLETFLDYLNAFPGEVGPYLEERCAAKAEAEQAAKALANAAEAVEAKQATEALSEASKQVRDCRINQLSRLAGFSYRTYAPSPEMLPVQEAGFRRSIELAHRINVVQWPKVGPGSYNERCASDEVAQMQQGGGSGAPPGATESADNRGTEENGGSSGKNENASSNEGFDAAKAREEFNLHLSRKCLAPYDDPYRLRALTRLLSVTEDLHRHSLFASAGGGADASDAAQADKATGADGSDAGQGAAGTAQNSGETAKGADTPSEDAARAALGVILASFNDVMPGKDGFTIDALRGEVNTLIAKGGQLSDLQQRCETAPAKAVGSGNAAIDNRRSAAIAYARCRFLYAPSSNVRGIMAEFIAARVRGDLNKFYRETAPAVNEYLTVSTDGCVLTSCRIRVDLRAENGEVNEKKLATDLAVALDKRTNGLSIYEIAPRAGTVIRRAGDGGDVSVGLAIPQGGAAAGTSRRDSAAYADAVVLGFGQVPAPAGSTSDQAEAVFGWTVRPQPRPGGGWSSSHHRLSAVISAPSWWKRLDLEIHACWITPKAARDHGDKLFVTPSNICATVYGDKPPEAEPAAAKTDASDAGAAGHFMRAVRVQLPRSVDEVTARFNFDLVKTPYFDPAWKRDNKGASNALMAGRPAHIALAGERLWRGTVVTIDGQPADRITVLPDMKGVIAEFRCVRPSPDASPDGSNQSRAMLTVWTAEGRTKPMEINVRPFQPVKDGDKVIETPCYMQQARAQKDGD